MAYEVLGNIVAELRKKGKFGGLILERMQSVIEGMWDKVKYALKDLQKLSGQLEECSDSKGVQSGLNISTFKYHFGGGRFHMLPQYYDFSHGL